MLENCLKREKYETSQFSPGGGSKLAKKSKGNLKPAQMLDSTEEAGGNAGGAGEQLEGKSLLNGDQVIVPGRGQELGVVPSYLVLPTERNVQGSKFKVSVTSVRLPFFDPPQQLWQG